MQSFGVGCTDHNSGNRGGWCNHHCSVAGQRKIKKPHWICNVQNSVYFCVCMWDHPKFVTFHEIIRETAAAQQGAAVFFKTINSMGNIYIIPSFRKPASAVSQFPQQHIRVKKIAAIRSPGCLFKT